MHVFQLVFPVEQTLKDNMTPVTHIDRCARSETCSFTPACTAVPYTGILELPEGMNMHVGTGHYEGCTGKYSCYNMKEETQR